MHYVNWIPEIFLHRVKAFKKYFYIFLTED